MKALRQDLGAKGAKRVRGLRTGLTNLQMQGVLGELQRSGKKMQGIAGSDHWVAFDFFWLDAMLQVLAKIPVLS